ncbi:hypothetical protein IWQ57_003224 [Coemansia nantahalensis]|uniref:Uncharacterized protein n=2 Tax=Coemansia TaxID=4863 RepID=A0ACC1LEZ7_9FUNG|nr:hypothetical protein IWQ57_003224 [Coemansia nantahalensis]KAJ2807369.1 hypothetical protein H4R21_000511 [Coemansia helicoidea]
MRISKVQLIPKQLIERAADWISPDRPAGEPLYQFPRLRVGMQWLIPVLNCQRSWRRARCPLFYHSVAVYLYEFDEC